MLCQASTRRGFRETFTSGTSYGESAYQQIEMLSREKHIEPEVVVSAIEDAMVVAARKYYKTEEDLRGKFNSETDRSMCFRS